MPNNDEIEDVLAKNLEYTGHIAYLCSIHTIKTYKPKKPGGECDIGRREIGIDPIVGVETYIEALHEIGHILTDHIAWMVNNDGSSSNRHWLTSADDEILAWIWARANAIHWNQSCNDMVIDALNSHRVGIRKQKKYAGLRFLFDGGCWA